MRRPSGADTARRARGAGDAPRPVYVEILIRATMDRLWDLTQDPDQHVRWDARFTRIIPTGSREDPGYEFRYEAKSVPDS